MKTISAVRSRASRPIFVSEGFWLWGLLRNLVTILLLGALALWLAPGVFSRAQEQMKQRSLASIGVGLIMLVAVLFAIPMISIALVMLGLIFSLTTLIDIAGIWFGLGFATLGFAAALFFTLFLWAGKLLLSYIIGSWLLARISPQATVNRFGALALGALVFAILAALPFFIGFLFSFVADLAGAGALWYAWRATKTRLIKRPVEFKQFPRSAAQWDFLIIQLTLTYHLWVAGEGADLDFAIFRKFQGQFHRIAGFDFLLDIHHHDVVSPGAQFHFFPGRDHDFADFIHHHHPVLHLR